MGCVINSIEETKDFIGDSMPKLCERALEATGGLDESHEVFYGAFKTRYMDAPAVKTKPMRAVRETLVTAKGHRLCHGRVYK